MYGVDVVKLCWPALCLHVGGVPKVGALYVFDESYWKRRCVEKLGWQNCQIAEHGLTWKQLFFEVSIFPPPCPLIFERPTQNFKLTHLSVFPR